MGSLAGCKFSRMNGLGNEIIVLDLRGANLVATSQNAVSIHHAPRLRYDQLMVLYDPVREGTSAFVRIFNNDGSESGSCGNGARCVAHFLMKDRGLETTFIETVSGVLECRRVGDDRYQVDMGVPRLAWNEIPLRDRLTDTRSIPVAIGPEDAPLLSGPSAVNMGNPHAVFFVADAAAVDLPRLGPALERHPMFPERANISVAQIIARDHIVLRVWERGVGITKACGSAACATLVAAVRRGLTDRRARITLPGGDLLIEWRAGDDRVLMTGPVELEFEGVLESSMFDREAT
jgi:diaminopimelate epimerase